MIKFNSMALINEFIIFNSKDMLQEEQTLAPKTLSWWGRDEEEIVSDNVMNRHTHINEESGKKSGNSDGRAHVGYASLTMTQAGEEEEEDHQIGGGEDTHSGEAYANKAMMMINHRHSLVARWSWHTHTRWKINRVA